MNRTHRILTVGGGLVLVLVAAIVLAACVRLPFKRAPTATAVPVAAAPTATATPAAAAPPPAAQAGTQASTATPVSKERVAPSPTPTFTATETPSAALSSASKEKPACGEGTLTVLLLGETDPETPGERGADAIRYLQVDFDRGAVRVLGIPPDLLVEAEQIPSLESELITLTAAYFRAKENRLGSEQLKMVVGARVVSQLLADQFGLSAEQYVAMKQPFVEELVDELGGLHIYIPEDVVGRPDGMGVFTEGWHDLEGWQVLEYVEILTPGPEAGPVEYARLARQRQVLEAVYTQLTQPETLIRLPGLIRVYRRNVVTDLRLPQFLDLGCVLGQEDLEVEYLTIGPDLVTPQDSVLVPHTDEIRAFVEEIFGE